MDFIFDPSLVLYLPLGQLDGTSFVSQDAYGHLCTVTGTVWGSHGRYFDGADDYVNANAAINAIQDLSVGTVMAWFNCNLVNYHNILTASDLSDPSSDLYLACLQKTGGDWRLAFFIREGGGSYLRVYSTNNVVAETWHFGAVAVSAKGNQLYLDGKAEVGDYLTGDSSTQKFFNTVQNIDSLLIGIGRDSGGYEAGFEGCIGEIWMYNRPLTPLEIQHIYLSTKWRYR